MDDVVERAREYAASYERAKSRNPSIGFDTIYAICTALIKRTEALRELADGRVSHPVAVQILARTALSGEQP